MVLFNERYETEIDLFFKGELRSFHSKEKGHVWICEHGNFDTLTIEPPEGGQYEIAVRIPYTGLEKDKYENQYPFSGYIAYDGYMWGVNTGGH